MNILYFGTVCDLNNYNNLLKGCSAKPSVAPVVFESSLLEGFAQNKANVEVHSFPMIPTFPKSKILFFGKNVEKLKCGYSCRWLYTFNIPVLKQISRRLDARKVIKKWGRANSGKGVIFTYSIPPFLVKDVIKYSRKFNMKTVAIIPDLLRDMYINDNGGSVISSLKNLYLKPALKRQGLYDGYIYLTDAMHNVVAPDKPYIVMEGIASTDVFSHIKDVEKTKVKSIMYAGMLHEKYGIINLLDAFENIDSEDAELWLFGDGSAVGEILKRAENNPRIKYFGMLNRNEILEFEKKATLLINPRDTQEEFTQYSFPSKTIEYMLSGTPLITTRLKGIPDEYFNYLFAAAGNSVDDLTEAINNALEKSDEELNLVGMRAQQFIIEEKNCCKQTAKIISFISEVQINESRNR